MGNLKKLTQEELLNTNAGHEGVAYHIGYIAGSTWDWYKKTSNFMVSAIVGGIEGAQNWIND